MLSLTRAETRGYDYDSVMSSEPRAQNGYAFLLGFHCDDSSSQFQVQRRQVTLVGSDVEHERPRLHKPCMKPHHLTVDEGSSDLLEHGTCSGIDSEERLFVPSK
jgi:hypothetical protein